ncbi:MAG: hypothetical protein NUV88_01815 [Candidatus Kaiserbacteria bacterium]|nr:hypothetical protein [Candidatus Kaiserbacteria bacterium]
MHWIRAHAILTIFLLIAFLSYLWYFSVKYQPQIRTAVPTYSILSEEDIPAKPSFSFGTETSVEPASGQSAEQTAQGVAYRQPFNSSAPAQNAGISYAPNTAETQGSAPEESNAQPKPMSTGLNSWFNNPYFLIPRGLISASIPTPKVRSSEEQALYDYGNAVGANIGNFESSNKNATEILKAFFPEKGGFSHQNQTAVNALVALGSGYSQLGNTLANMSMVPASAQALHTELAKSYADVGAGLAGIAKTGAEGDIIKAILAYDSTADIFIKNFVALAEFFSARGIKFSGSDPGAVFSFNPAGGL